MPFCWLNIKMDSPWQARRRAPPPPATGVTVRETLTPDGTGGSYAARIMIPIWPGHSAERPVHLVDNGPDLVVRNGTYLRVDVAPGDHSGP
jgi:hypothetical protein